jgi:hypothetical protein
MSEQQHAKSMVSGGIEALVPLVAAIVTGAGTLAFVAFFGGAILWDRIHTAGLPATEAVSLMPRSALLSTGAEFLAVALVLALAAVGVLAVTDWQLRRRKERLRARLDASMIDEQELLQLPTPVQQAASHVREARAALDTGDAAVQQAQTDLVAAAAQGGDVSAENEAANEARGKQATAKAAYDAADAALARAVDEQAEQRELLSRSIALGSVLGLALIAILLTRPSIAWWQYLVVALATATMSWLAVAIYQQTGKFLWFGVSAFFAVAIFQGLTTHFIITRHRQMEPAAALITGQQPVTGAFVAQTKDRIYLGTPVDDPVSLTALRRDKVTDFAIGNLTDHDEVAAEAAKLRDALTASR